MKRILFDTNAYAAFKRGDSGASEVVRLAEFLASPRVEMLPLGSDTAEHYARTFQSLRRKGRPIPTNDLWVAASALEHGYAVYTHDEHFREIDGLVTGKSPAAFLP